MGLLYRVVPPRLRLLACEPMKLVFSAIQHLNLLINQLG